MSDWWFRLFVHTFGPMFKKLSDIEGKVDKIMATQQELDDALEANLEAGAAVTAALPALASGVTAAAQAFTDAIAKAQQQNPEVDFTSEIEKAKAGTKAAQDAVTAINQAVQALNDVAAKDPGTS